MQIPLNRERFLRENTSPWLMFKYQRKRVGVLYLTLRLKHADFWAFHTFCIWLLINGWIKGPGYATKYVNVNFRDRMIRLSTEREQINEVKALLLMNQHFASCCFFIVHLQRSHTEPWLHALHAVFSFCVYIEIQRCSCEAFPISFPFHLLLD